MLPLVPAIVFCARGYNAWPGFSQNEIQSKTNLWTKLTPAFTVEDLGANSVEVKSDYGPHIHPVALQHHVDGVRLQENKFMVVPMRYTEPTPFDVNKVPPGMPKPEPPDAKYYYHTGICTMHDVDYNNFGVASATNPTGHWHGVVRGHLVVALDRRLGLGAHSRRVELPQLRLGRGSSQQCLRAFVHMAVV